MTRGNVDLSIIFDQNGHPSVINCNGAATTSPVSLSPADEQTKAANVVAQLRDHQYQSVLASLDPLGRTYQDAINLQTSWQTFERAYGPSVAQGPPASSGGLEGVDIPATWARACSHVVVYFDGNYQVSAVILLLADAPPTAIDGETVPPSPGPATEAAAIINELAAGQFSAVAKSLDPLGAAMTTAAGLQHAWQTTVGRLGRLERVGPPVLLVSTANFLDYQFDLRFQHGAGNVQIYLDAHNRILEPIVKTGPATGISGQ
jgi:hypothetical protein